MLLLAGLPLMFMELAFGQYASLGPIAIYQKFCPMFRGLGYGMVMISGIVMLYYNILIAWTLFYMFASWTSNLPWEKCEPAWSTSACYSYVEAEKCMAQNETYFNATCYNATAATVYNISELIHKRERTNPSQEYFYNYMLGLSSGIEETGSIQWPLALCLMLAWIIVFLCLSQGVKTSGKVVYFTALFPYVVLVILFFRGVTLPGAGNGILFYLMPDWSHLMHANIWGDAAVQIFFALSPSWGGLITLASYNKFNNNCYKDALIVSISNVLTSFFAGFVIFSIIGYLAYEMNVEIKEVVQQGPGLAFTVYPEVVKRFPISPAWAFLFFFMLLTLGLDSQFALMETVTTAILDQFTSLRDHKLLVVLLVTVLGYLGGLIFTTQAGMYWLQLLDKYAANWSVLIIAIIECILISWYYGADQFSCDIQEMIGVKSYAWRMFWNNMWKYFTPTTLIFVLIFNWIDYTPAHLDKYKYPFWANVVGWILALLPIFVIVIIAIHKVYTVGKGSLLERIQQAMKPTDDWGPAAKSCTGNNLECDDSALDDDDGGLRMTAGPGVNGNSFDNPSFKTATVLGYSFETTI